MKRVGILRGGQGENYTSSLKKGGEIILYISENLSHKYKVFDILVDKENVWHINGLPVVPVDLIHRVDVVWNTAHPSLSVVLDNFAIPNIGMSSFSSALENTKEILREHMKSINVKMPRSIVLPVYQKDFDGPREKYASKKAKEVFGKFSSPWIVKSLTPDLSMGIHLAKTFPELVDAIDDGVQHEKSILIEEFITGKVASIHSVAGFRGEKIYTFPLGNSFGHFSLLEKEKLINVAKYLYDHLDARHYLKSNFILSPRGKVYLTDIETNPDLKQDSHFCQVCDLVGTKVHQIVEHILEKKLMV